MAQTKLPRFYNLLNVSRSKSLNGKIVIAQLLIAVIALSSLHLSDPDQGSIVFVMAIWIPFILPLWWWVQSSSVSRRLAEHESKVIAPSSPYDFTLSTALYRQFDAKEGSKILRSLLLKQTHKWQVYDLEFMRTTDGASAQIAQYHTVFEGVLSREVPNIVFDSHVAHGKQFRSYFVGAQRVTLDADMGDYYDAYVPSSYSIDTLSIIGPEVLYAMREFTLPCDIEFVGKTMVCYAPLLPYDKVDEFESQCAGLLKVFDDTLINYRDDHTYGKDRRTAVHGFARELMRSPFYRWPALVLSMATFIGIIVFVTINQQWDEFFMTPVWLLILCIIAIPEPVLCFLQWRRNTRRKKSFEASQRFVTARQADIEVGQNSKAQ